MMSWLINLFPDGQSTVIKFYIHININSMSPKSQFKYVTWNNGMCGIIYNIVLLTYTYS